MAFFKDELKKIRAFVFDVDGVLSRQEVSLSPEGELIRTSCAKDGYAIMYSGKKGYVIALRTGLSMKECEKIIESIEHFYGHMEIECCDRMGLCSVEYKEDLECKKEELVEFCSNID
jgi:3-deoxy-D-manno-octulosonate 8-phosphate phosphatase KdsC-like HAD superfamily phosphatase